MTGNIAAGGLSISVSQLPSKMIGLRLL